MGHFASALGDMEGKLSSADAWEITGIPLGQRRQEHNDLLGEALRELGWKRKKLRFDRPTPLWGYVRGPGSGSGKKTYHQRIIVDRDNNGRMRAQYELSGGPA